MLNSGLRQVENPSDISNKDQQLVNAISATIEELDL